MRLVTHGGADIFAADNEGNTVLHLAAKGSRFRVVQALFRVHHGKIVQWLSEQPATRTMNDAVDGLPLSLIRNNSGDLAIHLACKNRKSDVMRFLLESPDGGVTVGLADALDNTPLHVVCQTNDLDFVKRLVQEFGADMNRPNNSGETPLSIACEFERFDLIIKRSCQDSVRCGPEEAQQWTLLLKI